MKKVFLFLFTISLIFNSCSSDNDNNEEFDIVGTWEETKRVFDVDVSHGKYRTELINAVTDYNFTAYLQ